MISLETVVARMMELETKYYELQAKYQQLIHEYEKLKETQEKPQHQRLTEDDIDPNKWAFDRGLEST